MKFINNIGKVKTIEINENKSKKLKGEDPKGNKIKEQRLLLDLKLTKL